MAQDRELLNTNHGLTMLSLLPPSDRIQILERAVARDHSVALFDKLAMAYAKNNQSLEMIARLNKAVAAGHLPRSMARELARKATETAQFNRTLPWSPYTVDRSEALAKLHRQFVGGEGLTHCCNLLSLFCGGDANHDE